MLDAVGRALAAAVRRFGPVPAPWQLAVVITGGAILACGGPRGTAQAEAPQGLLRHARIQTSKTADEDA